MDVVNDGPKKMIPSAWRGASGCACGAGHLGALVRLCAYAVMLNTTSHTASFIVYTMSAAAFLGD